MSSSWYGGSRAAANRPPTITLPQGKTKFTFKIGQESPKDAWVGRVVANDPDGDALTYEITDGNMGGYFKFNTGPAKKDWLRVAQTLPATVTGPWDLTVKVKDNRGGEATAQVRIELKPFVVMTGDLQAIEEGPGAANPDIIKLNFRRIASDITGALTVKFKVTWDSAELADLDDPPAEFTAGEIEIPAGESLVSMSLKAEADEILEDREQFTGELLDTDDYVSLQGDAITMSISALHDTIGIKKAPLTILDAVTLFASDNDEADLRDPGGTNGIHMNDIRQGAVGKCSFMAAVATMAQRTPAVLQLMMRDNGDGTASVAYYEYAGAPVSQVTVSMSMPLNLEQARMSKDYTDDWSSPRKVDRGLTVIGTVRRPPG